MKKTEIADAYESWKLRDNPDCFRINEEQEAFIWSALNTNKNEFWNPYDLHIRIDQPKSGIEGKIKSAAILEKLTDLTKGKKDILVERSTKRYASSSICLVKEGLRTIQEADNVIDVLEKYNDSLADVEEKIRIYRSIPYAELDKKLRQFFESWKQCKN